MFNIHLVNQNVTILAEDGELLSQACADAGLFRRKEWIEDLFFYVVRDARTVVRNFDHDVCADLFCGDCDLAAFFAKGVEGVDDQIQDQLGQLRFISFYILT